ncbi:hypothetical protein F4054_13180 [Candidatus Poribacteria bacterium]|nr:hypothetical protein [Candidatus Poribacteria bacterium]MYG09222.1 hypothetical protein [Candidatus Poribacteria bacterium]MYK23197.1 hypothetical protein [Candidatus Poribacteria bacterium]
MTFLKRTAFCKILTLLVICALIGSFVPLSHSAGESGYGDVFTKVYGFTSALYLRLSGSQVSANFSTGCNNYYLVDASCAYSFKIALIKLGGQWDVEISRNDTSGGGTAPGNNDPDAYENWYSHTQTLSASANNLDPDARSRIDTYCRLTVSVPNVGSEDWFSSPSHEFEP